MKSQVSFWGIARRWWWLALCGVLIAVAISYHLTSQQTPIYVAKATVSVGESIGSADVNSQMLALSRTLAYTYAEFVRRRPVTQAVIEARGLNMTPEQLANAIHVNVVPNAQLLEILVFDADPEQAAATANEVARQLIEEQSPTANSADWQQWEMSRQAAEAQVADIREQIAELRARIPNLTAAAELAEARDRLTQLQGLFVEYQQVAAQYAQLTASNPANRVWLVEAAIPNYAPVSPNRTMNLILSAVLGLVVTGGAVVLLEFFDDTLRWRDKGIDEVAKLPVLGVLAPPSRRDPVVLSYQPRSQAAEAVRQLRARIALTRSPHSLRVLMVTSARPIDGKTTTVANLGVASATAGMSTLIIDADMREPSQHELFDAPNVVGLADLLRTKLDEREALIDKAVIPTSTPNLSLLTSGVAGADPAALLGLPETGALLASLKARYDYVVIDTPPVLVAPDAAILAPMVEGVVLVARIGRTTRRLVRKSRERLEAPGNVNVLGVALTGVPAKIDERSGLRHYHYMTDPPAPDWRTRLYDRLTFLHRLPVGHDWKQRNGTVLIPISVAARQLGVRPATVKQWCKSRRLKGVHKLGRWWVPERELASFVAREREKVEQTVTRPSEAVPTAQRADQEGAGAPKVLPFTHLDVFELEQAEAAKPKRKS